MTLVDDRRPKASGTTTEQAPPLELPDVYDAQQFYLLEAGAQQSAWSYHHLVPRPVCYIEPRSGGLGRLVAKLSGELTRLGQLHPGWDGRQAKPITQQAAYAAVGVVLTLMLDGQSEFPQFFPLPDGGIQVEWYADDQVEIAIDGRGEAHVLATAANGDVVAEGIFDPRVPSELAATTTALVKRVSAQFATERRQR